MSKVLMKLFIFIIVFSISAFGQSADKSACSKKDKAVVRAYFEQLERQNKIIAECEEANKSKNPLPPLVIAGKCEFGGDGCPVLLVKPKMPKIALQMKINASVKVEVIADEAGNVIYSQMIEGNKIFKKSAESAACKAVFSPKRYCGAAFKSKNIIVYNFVN